MAHLGSIAFNRSKPPDEATLTDIKDITERVGLLCSIMNLGAYLTEADIEDLFVPASSYRTSSGSTRVQDVKSIVTLLGEGGSNTNGKLMAIRNVRLVSDETANSPGRGI